MSGCVFCGDFASRADGYDMFAFSTQMDLLEKMMDTSQLRHRVISQNIANVNTPGYERLEVEFEQQLTRVLKANASGALQDLEPVIERQSALPHRADGNNVNIDREIGELNRNALLYQTYVQVLSTQLSQMRAAMSGP